MRLRAPARRPEGARPRHRLTMLAPTVASIAALVGGTLALSALPARASGTVDQQSTEISGGAYTMNWSLEGDNTVVDGSVSCRSPYAPSSPYVAQGFHPNASGLLDRVDLYLGDTFTGYGAFDTPGPLTVEIENVAGTSIDRTGLASATLPASSIVSTGGHWVEVDFSTPPVVQAGQGYAILAWGANSTSGCNGWDWYRSTGDAYGSLVGDTAWEGPTPDTLSQQTGTDMAFKTYVSPAADPWIAMTADSSVRSGAPITYQITIGNNGPDPASAVTVSDTTPYGMVFSSVTVPTGWTCATPRRGKQGTITCKVPSLGVGESAPMTIVMNTVRKAGVGVVTNQATVSTTTVDLDASNDSAAVSTTVTK